MFPNPSGEPFPKRCIAKAENTSWNGTRCSKGAHGDQLELELRSNEVLVSCPLGAKLRRPSSPEPGKPICPPRDLPAEISLKDFPGTSDERPEALQISSTYADVFACDESSLGRTTVMQHQISTCDDIPANQWHRLIPPTQLADVKEHLQDLLNKGVIRSS